jgi:hypothetical protein
VTANNSIKASQEWLADYLGRLEAARHKWHSDSVARLQASIKARPRPEGLPEEQPQIILPDE